MKKKGNSPLRTQLNVLVVACILPVVLAMAAQMFFGYHRSRGLLTQASTDIARAMSNAVDQELASVTGSLWALAAAPELRAGDLGGFQRFAAGVLPSQPSVNSFVLLNPDGQQLMNTLRPIGSPLPREADQQRFRPVFEKNLPLVSDLFIGAVMKKPVIAVTVPVRIGERVAYALAAGCMPERLNRVLERSQQNTEWVVSIFDSQGTIVARTHDPARFVGHKGAPALLERMKQVREDSVDVDTLEGIPVVASFSRSNVSGWTVAIGIPRAQLTRDLRREMLLLAVSSVLLLMAGLGLAQALASRIAHSIRALVQPAEMLGRGEEPVVPPLHVKEAEELGQALLDAAALLKLRTEERDRATDAQRSLLADKDKLERMAHYDALTGLMNRAQFTQRLNDDVADWRRDGQGLTLFYLDLDGFKAVNDEYGHAVGDQLLSLFAARLRAAVRETDVLARLGGDEFAVLLPGLKPEQAGQLAKMLVERLSRPYVMGPLTVSVSASIGMASCPESASDANALIAAADAAMYRAKKSGKGRVER